MATTSVDADGAAGGAPPAQQQPQPQPQPAPAQFHGQYAGAGAGAGAELAAAAEQAAPTTLTSLPLELLSMVADFLSPRHVANTRLACHKLRDAVDHKICTLRVPLGRCLSNSRLLLVRGATTPAAALGSLQPALQLAAASDATLPAGRPGPPAPTPRSPPATCWGAAASCSGSNALGVPAPGWSPFVRKVKILGWDDPSLAADPELLEQLELARASVAEGQQELQARQQDLQQERHLLQVEETSIRALQAELAALASDLASLQVVLLQLRGASEGGGRSGSSGGAGADGEGAASRPHASPAWDWDEDADRMASPPLPPTDDQPGGGEGEEGEQEQGQQPAEENAFKVARRVDEMQEAKLALLRRMKAGCSRVREAQDRVHGAQDAVLVAQARVQALQAELQQLQHTLKARWQSQPGPQQRAVSVAVQGAAAGADAASAAAGAGAGAQHMEGVEQQQQQQQQEQQPAGLMQPGAQPQGPAPGGDALLPLAPLAVAPGDGGGAELLPAPPAGVLAFVDEVLEAANAHAAADAGLALAWPPMGVLAAAAVANDNPQPVGAGPPAADAAGAGAAPGEGPEAVGGPLQPVPVPDLVVSRQLQALAAGLVPHLRQLKALSLHQLPRGCQASMAQLLSACGPQLARIKLWRVDLAGATAAAVAGVTKQQQQQDGAEDMDVDGDDGADGGADAAGAAVPGAGQARGPHQGQGQDQDRAFWAAAAGLPGLQELVLRDGVVTPADRAGLVQLAGLRKLKVLHVTNLPPGLSCLSQLAHLTQLTIEDLQYEAGPIHDEFCGLSRLTGLASLSFLVVGPLPAEVLAWSALTGLTRLEITNHYDENLLPCFGVVLPCLQRLAELHLSNFEVNAGLLAALRPCSRLATLRMGRFNVAEPYTLPPMPSVTSLSLGLVDDLQQCEVPLITVFPCLQRLELLTRFTLSQAAAARIPQQLLMAAPAPLATLRHLHLYDALLGSGPVLPATCPFLESLDLLWSQSDPPDLIATLGGWAAGYGHSHGLTSLGWAYCDGLLDEHVELLAAQLKGLRKLSLGGCDKLTDAGVGSLSTLTALTALLLSGNTKITAEGLAPVVRGCEGLELLEVSRMPRVRTEDCVRLEALSGRLGLQVVRKPAAPWG